MWVAALDLMEYPYRIYLHEHQLAVILVPHQMHTRIELDVRSGDRLAIDHLHIEHVLAGAIRNSGDYPIMKNAQVDLTRHRWISPPLRQLAHCGVVVDVTPQDEAARADAGTAPDSHLCDGEGAYRAVRVAG